MIAGLPKPDLRHLWALTDNSGVLQHATFTTPNRHYGYCTDDNARALIVACWCSARHPDLDAERMVPIYLAFLLHAFDRSSGRFRNFLSYDRRWLKNPHIDDPHGRALWALGIATRDAPTVGARRLARELFRAALPAIKQLRTLRSLAFSLLGLDAFLASETRAFEACGLQQSLVEKLFSAFPREASSEWQWCETKVTFDNAKLPHGLLVTGRALNNHILVRSGLVALAWLLEQQTATDGHLSPVGNAGWFQRGGVKAQFDQQPLEAMALVEACAEAFRVTADPFWRQQTEKCFAWFLGRNDLALPLYDSVTGGCHDGLQCDRLNENQGAESTLAWLISLLTMHELVPLP